MSISTSPMVEVLEVDLRLLRLENEYNKTTAAVYSSGAKLNAIYQSLLKQLLQIERDNQVRLIACLSGRKLNYKCCIMCKCPHKDTPLELHPTINIIISQHPLIITIVHVFDVNGSIGSLVDALSC